MKNEIVSSNIPKVPVRIILPGKSRAVEKNRRISELHYHDEVEFLYVLDGKLLLKTPDETFVISKGEIAFISTRTVHETFFADDAYSGSLIQFRIFDYMEEFAKKLAGFINSDEISVHIFRSGRTETDELIKIFECMFSETNEKKQGYETYIKGAVYNLLGFLIRQNFIKNSNFLSEFYEGERFLPVIDYIDKNYAEKITLEDLGKTANLSCEHLCRCFKKMSGSTLGDYINFVRVSKAEKMLSTTDKTISEVAFDTGFASVSYFNRVFKKYKKCSPSVYKKIKFAIK